MAFCSGVAAFAWSPPAAHKPGQSVWTLDPAIFLAIAAALISMFFAACGVALRVHSRKRLGDLLDDKDKAHKLDPFLEKLPALILMTGMLRACFSLIVVLSLHQLLEDHMPEASRWEVYTWAFVISCLVVSVFVVALPASLGKYWRERLIVAAMPLLNLITSKPVLWIPYALHLIDPVVRRISGHDREHGDQDVSDELMLVVEESEYADHVDDEQREMLEAVFDLPNTDAADLMTPRTDIRGLELGTPTVDVLKQIIDIGHSRIPVYDESMDRIAGVLYVKDLLPLLNQALADLEHFDLKTVLREPYMVPEGKKIADLIADFKQRKIQMALVIDEHGGTAGLITIEDIMEELVGDLQDEYEVEDEPEQIVMVDANTAEVDARAHIDAVNHDLDLDLPNDQDFDTLGGFVLDQMGRIPESGEQFESDTVRFTVLEAERTRVNRVRIEWDLEDGGKEGGDA